MLGSALLPRPMRTGPGVALAFGQRWAQLGPRRAARPVHRNGPSRVNLGPILSRTPLVENAVEDVGVDDIGPGDGDVISRGRCRRGDETSGVGIVTSED